MYKIRVKAKKYWKPTLVEEVHTATVWAMDYFTWTLHQFLFTLNYVDPPQLLEIVLT